MSDHRCHSKSYRIVLSLGSVYYDLLRRVVLNFADETRVFPQYFHLVFSFIMLYSEVVTFKSVDETLLCNRSNESFLAVLHVVHICRLRVGSHKTVTEVLKRLPDAAG